MLRAACALLLLHLVHSQNYPFCLDGISLPDFADDAGDPSVDIILAQAPLFSTNPAIGNKLGLLNLYHTSLVFAQRSDASVRYWTLEFDFTGGNILRGIAPFINGDELTWDSDARYCLTEGLLWGREHWTKSFEVAMTLTADQVLRAFTDFVIPVNSTASATKPQYQLWRVAQFSWFGRPKRTLVEDITCADGAVWFLHHVATKLQVAPRAGFRSTGTATYVDVNRLEPVDTDDPIQWRDVVKFYRKIVDLTSANKSFLHRLFDLMNIAVSRKYVYDTNTKVYYRIHSTTEPWLRFELVEYPLVGPPWLPSSDLEEIDV